MGFEAYPKHKYHAEHEPVEVQSKEEEAELGDEWANSPAEHGVITQPSVEQTRQAKLKALAKDAGDASTDAAPVKGKAKK